MYAALGVTLNPVPPSTSEPVIIVTLLPPTGAVGETEMVAVAVVGLVTTRSATVTPAPRMASVGLGQVGPNEHQLVSDPVMVTSSVEPCGALSGTTPSSVGLAGASTEKLPSTCSAPVTCSLPVST